jgi:hypothetical protein
MKLLLVGVWTSLRSALAPVLFMLLVPSGVAAQTSNVYQQLADLEYQYSQLPPAPYATIDMGTWNAATRIFDGLTKQEQTYIPAPGKPERTRIVPASIMVNEPDVELVFHVVNASDLLINCPGIRLDGPGTTKRFLIHNAPAKVHWSIPPGLYEDDLYITHPPGLITLVPTGVIRIPALPVAIIYEPPQPPGASNSSAFTWVEFGQTTGIGSTIRMSFEQTDALTKPVDSSFDTAAAMGTALKAAGGLASTGSSPAAKGAGAILTAIGDKLVGMVGSESHGNTEGSSVTNGHALQLFDTSGTIAPTWLHKGPGIGDVFLLDTNVGFQWLSDSGTLLLAVVSHDETWPPGQMMASDLLSPLKPAKSGLSPDVIRSLLELDPFVSIDNQGQVTFNQSPDLGDPKFNKRFVHDLSYRVTGPMTKVFGTVKFETSESGWTNFKGYVDDYREGWLHDVIGVGPSSTVTYKGGSVNAKLEAKTTMEAMATTVHFGYVDEPYGVAVWRDRLFGTVAFTSQPLTQFAKYSGALFGRNGKPLRNEEIKITVDGKTYATRTDSRGKFRFDFANMPTGRGKISVRQIQKDVVLPISNQTLRLPLTEGLAHP